MHPSRVLLLGSLALTAGVALARASASPPAAGTAPALAIHVPAADAHWRPGSPIAFAGEAVDAEDGALPASAYAWTLALDDCTAAGCERRVLETRTGAVAGTFTAPDHRFASPLELSLTVADATGLEASAAVMLLPADAPVGSAGPRCGDGTVDPGEACDDGNDVDGDCCSASCSRAPDGATCGDADVCNGIETCRAGTCVGAPALACDDRNPCTDDACDPAGGCRHAANTAPCDDDVACTVDDRCSEGTCRGASRCGDDRACNVGSGSCEDAPPLPSPWREAAVGVGTGTTRYDWASGDFRIAGADGLRFVHQPLNGDGEIVARVTGVASADRRATAGVMMRDALDEAGLRAAVMLTADDLSLERCVPAENADGGTGGEGAGAAPTWVRLARRGDRFEGACSRDGTHWIVVGTQTIPMGGTVLAGLALRGREASATFQAVRVTAGPSRRPPIVAIASPEAGAVLIAPATFDITVDAADPDGSVTMVELLQGTESLGLALSGPYRFRWRHVQTGTYSLVARVTDSRGDIVSSAPVTVSVIPPIAEVAGTASRG